MLAFLTLLPLAPTPLRGFSATPTPFFELLGKISGNFFVQKIPEILPFKKDDKRAFSSCGFSGFHVR
jgi:hypothetical protein